MAGRAAETAAVFALAAMVAAAIAAPVLRAPSERLFGMEIVGRHHDPFTVMAQFGRPIAVGVYLQPVTDIPGVLIARLSGAVAAYNWLVLLSFPLAAAAAYLLGRHLALSPTAATVAAMAYAFSPFHLSHAAYHVHIAQTQWIPLYLLALWRCLDRGSPAAVAFLGAATLAVTLSNFYGGLIAAVLTPVALASYWFATPAGRRSVRGVTVTIASLALIAAAGLAYTWLAAPGVVTGRAAFAFPRIDLFRYSATWWSYLVPPVEHPLLGAAARRLWSSAGVGDGLLEQQVSLGWGIIALGLIASSRWALSSDARRSVPLAGVPILLVVALAAFVCSLSPDWTIGGLTIGRPSRLLYDVVPMFRSYARFGLVVQLMAALLAGLGVDYLRRSGTSGRVACALLVVLAASEYAVVPSAMWRDVLPTTAHRWVARQAGHIRALDCVPPSQESESVQWLTGDRITVPAVSTGDCGEPHFPEKLAAMGYTHLLVRHEAGGGPPPGQAVVDGLRVAAQFPDAQLFAVTAPTPALYTATMTGFFPRERDAAWTWRWMGTDAIWTVVNTTARPIVADLAVELSAFHNPRRMELLLDGKHVRTLVVNPARHFHELGPLALGPGAHGLVFRPAEAPTRARDVIGNGDRRRLSFAVGSWAWRVRGEQP